jgi:hypothetical protein
VRDDDSIDIIKLIQLVKNFVQLVRATHEATSNHQTNQDDEKNDSLNHAIEMIKNLLQEARQQIAANNDLVNLADHADHADQSQELIEQNNSLVLNYLRSKIRHDYKQLHHRDFVKSVIAYEIKTLVIYEEAMIDSQAN